MLTEFGVVNQIEKGDHSNGQLHPWHDSAEFWLHVFVVPAPVEAAAGSAPVDRVLAASGQPCWELAQLHLVERLVSCKMDTMSMILKSF